MLRNKILIVDDVKELRTLVRSHLEGLDYRVAEAASCAEALEAARSFGPDLAVLDIMLPDGDGFSLFGRLHGLAPALPILFLSARDEDEARLRGLGLGADDYLTKPFLLSELSLRIAAVLRRTYRDEAAAADTLQLGEASIHWGRAEVTVRGKTSALTATEYKLLQKLAENRGNIVTVDALCRAVWSGELVGYENTLMVHVRRLREKLEPDPSHPALLLTVRGLGYRLAGDLR